MYAMEQFIQSVALLVLLTVCAIFSAPNPYLIFLSAGLLMIVFTIRSLSEEQHPLLSAAWLLLSAAFAVLANGVFPHMIFYELRALKTRRLRFFLPAISLLLTATIRGQTSFPLLLLEALLLTACSCLLSLLETCWLSYSSVKKQLVQSVNVTAVNELYEKKLNQELIIKNYLADKNARLEERESISRSIHNNVGHSITAAIMALDAADLLFDSNAAQAREKVRLANERIRGSLDSIRHAVRVLDNEAQFIQMDDFVRELISVIDSFMMDTAIRIRFDCSFADQTLMLPHEHAEFLTGALQELLSNGVRHGNADLFTVYVTTDSAHIQLNVSDNGRSDFSKENQQKKIQTGFGLKKLISYAKRCGGMTEFKNNNGFQAAITLPLFPKHQISE